MSRELVSGADLRNAADNDLDEQAQCIKVSIAKLLELLNRDDARCWEQVYRIRDLAEEVQRLKRQLRNSLPLGDPDNASQEVMSALEVAQEQTAEEQRAKILQLHRELREAELRDVRDAELRKLRDALQRERSKNWDLAYQCQDLREEVWRLMMHLGHSITISDWEESPLVPKTARERALEKKVRGLEKRVKEVDDKARNKDVRIGETDGTGRARSRSM